MRRDRWEGLLIGLIVGAAAGVLGGLLVAPSTGREARRRLAGATARFRDEAGDAVDRLIELGDALAEWGWDLFGSEADRTRSRLAELKADVERMSSARG
jgi:gas vesicle protein